MKNMTHFHILRITLIITFHIRGKISIWAKKKTRCLSQKPASDCEDDTRGLFMTIKILGGFVVNSKSALHENQFSRIQDLAQSCWCPESSPGDKTLFSTDGAMDNDPTITHKFLAL